MSSLRSAAVGLEAEGLAKTFTLKKKGQTKVIEALRGVSFSAHPGDVIGVIGPSRSGKTSLLRIVAGVSLPNAGRVTGAGRVVPLIVPGAGFDDENSGYRNAHDTATLYDIPPAVAEKKIDEMFRFAGIERFREVPVSRYSRGMRLRLAFAVALGLEPDILMLDDVLGVGDLDFQEKCIARLQALADSGAIVMLVSHDFPTLSRLCTRLLWLENGKVVREGAPGELLDDYAKSSARVAEANVLHFSRGASENKHCKFTSVRLVDDAGAAIERPGVADRIGIRLEFEMLSSRFEPRCSVDLFARGGLAFRSEAAPASLGAGHHVTTVWIPAGLLAATTYAVRAEVTLGKRDQVRRTDLSINVNGGTDQEETGRWLSNFAGRVAPDMDWQIDCVRRSSGDA